eukprot:m.40581 g.40581  ORF g.40581 m.40581 type:complete len:1133 (+) comp5621_c0_seq1:33-3431(+)
MDQHPAPRLVHTEGHVEICYDTAGSRIITCGADKSIRIFAGYDDEEATTIDRHTAAVTCVAVKLDRLVSASEDHEVLAFDLKKKDEDQCIGCLTRFTLAVRAIAFNPTGSTVAAASDDFDIKLVAMIDSSVKTLRGHEGSVRGLSFDPEGEYLASSSSDGTVRFWRLKDHTCVKTLACFPRHNDITSAPAYKIAWHPNGKYIAIPSGKGIAVYERDSWAQAFAFNTDGHSTNVVICAWSPNGEYLASVSVDGDIYIWDLKGRLSLDRYRHPQGLSICSLAWHPRNNELAWADTSGKFSVWREPVSASSAFMAPTDGPIAALQASEQTGMELAALFDDDDDVPRRLRKGGKKSAALSDDELDAAPASKPASKGDSSKDTAADDSNDREVEERWAPEAPYSAQAAFQPSSTPLDSDRRYLVWNHVGVITSRAEELNAIVDVEFHNSEKQRPIKIVDHYGYTMGALSDHSLALAAPSCSDPDHTNPSVLFCRPYDARAADEPWHVYFPEGEEIEALAVGAAFVAVVTSKRYVRVYSITGTVRMVFSLEGDVVCISAMDENLVVVYAHARAPPQDQCLQYLIVNIDDREMVSKGALPISAGAELTWLGFSDIGMPATVDSHEIVRMLDMGGGGWWVPVAEMMLPKEKDKPQQYHWVTSIIDMQVVSVLCKGEQFPRVGLPRPETMVTPLSVPLAGMADTQAFEQTHFLSKLSFKHLDRFDMFENEKERLAYKKKLDTPIIGCISKAVQKQRSGRALDFATMLSLENSVDFAVKLAVKANLSSLAEKMYMVKQLIQRAARDSPETPSYAATPAPRSQPRPRLDTTPLRSETPTFATPRARVPSTHSPAADSDDDDDARDARVPPVRAAPARKGEPVRDAAPKRASTADDDDDSQKPAGTSQPMFKSPAVLPKASNPFARTGSDQPKTISLPRSTSLVEAVAEGSPEKKRKTAPSATNLLMQAGLKKAKPTPKDTKDKPKRVHVKSAYMLWLEAERKNIKEKFPGLQPKEILTKAGELWRNMTEEAKKVWNEKHTALATAAKNAPADSTAKPMDDDDTAADAPDAPADETQEARGDGDEGLSEENTAKDGASQAVPDPASEPMDADSSEDQPAEREEKPVEKAPAASRFGMFAFAKAS